MNLKHMFDLKIQTKSAIRSCLCKKSLISNEIYQLKKCLQKHVLGAWWNKLKRSDKWEEKSVCVSSIEDKIIEKSLYMLKCN